MSYLRTGMGDARDVYECTQMCSRVYLPGDPTAYASCSAACSASASIPRAPGPTKPATAPPPPGQPPAAPGAGSDIPWHWIGAAIAGVLLLRRRR